MANIKVRNIIDEKSYDDVLPSPLAITQAVKANDLSLGSLATAVSQFYAGVTKSYFEMLKVTQPAAKRPTKLWVAEQVCKGEIGVDEEQLRKLHRSFMRFASAPVHFNREAILVKLTEVTEAIGNEIFERSQKITTSQVSALLDAVAFESEDAVMES